MGGTSIVGNRLHTASGGCAQSSRKADRERRAGAVYLDRAGGGGELQGAVVGAEDALRQVRQLKPSVGNGRTAHIVRVGGRLGECVLSATFLLSPLAPVRQECARTARSRLTR